MTKQMLLSIVAFGLAAAVTVQGQPHEDFDPWKETITLPPGGGTIAVRAKY